MPKLHYIPASHPSLQGHFPGSPVVPGVLLLNTVLQCVQASHGALRLLAAPQVKFLQPLLPDQDFSIALSGGLPVLTFVCQRGADVLAQGKLQFELPAP